MVFGRPFWQVSCLYVLFAVIATVVNIGVQILLDLWHDDEGAWLLFSIFCGTLAGLIIKYLLDKNYIFLATKKVPRDEVNQFLKYTLVGIFTTLVFWGSELLFHVVFQTPFMRYIGGILGLAIGYVLKFWIDYKYVFNERK